MIKFEERVSTVLQPLTTPSLTSALTHCAALFLPGDPPRSSRIAFWQPDGSQPTPPLESATPIGDPVRLTVILPSEAGEVSPYQVPALALPVLEALPVLTRARAARTGTAAEFWGAAAVLALRLVARGRLLPGLTGSDHDAWRAGPLAFEDTEDLRALAAAAPPYAHAAPLPGTEPLRLPEPTRLIRSFLDAVADELPRTPAAELAAGAPAFASAVPQHIPEQRPWVEEVAAGQDAGVRLSLRIETEGLETEDASEDGDGEAPLARFHGVLQLHSLTEPGLVADATDVWAHGTRAAAEFGPHAHTDALLTLRRAARAWEPLAPLLSAAVPDTLQLADDDVVELLSPPVARALQAAGVQIHWPAELARELTAHAVIGPGEDSDGKTVPSGSLCPEGGDTDSGAQGDTDGSGAPSTLTAEALLSFNWHFAVGGHSLSRAELDQLAEARRPVVRLHGQWMLVDPETVRAARRRRDTTVAPLEALRTVLTGTSEHDGELVSVSASGWLETLRERLADPDGTSHRPVAVPDGLKAELRDYQLRGLDWLHRMTSLGLGCCLADDMGLGKTVTLIALHLHRQRETKSAGPTLVVCPASLLSNWQREIERFAPGTPVRRYHGTARSLEGLTDGEFVLTTYGTMRIDAHRLATQTPFWGMVAADEAQHIKNPFSDTAKRLRTIPSGARVALTGTPVENNLSELWSVLDWATPGLLGRLGTFRTKYADAVESGTDLAAAQRLAKLVRPFLLRRHKTDPGIAPELPTKTETDRAVSLTREQVGLYEAVVREGLADVSGTEGFARRGLVVRLLTSLKQICNHPAQYLGEEESKLSGRSGKLELLDELLDSILAEGAGVLLFTQYVRMGRLLEHHLAMRGVSTEFLHGGTPVVRREGMVRRFQDGEVPVFLLSLKAAGTGLNLTRASHVIHYDRWWNPAVEAQATDRAYRIGQTQAVQVHRLVTEGTIEDRIADMLRRKEELAEAVLGSGEAALGELSDSELAQLVELRRDER